MTKPTFDMEAAIEALRAGKDLTGKDGILTQTYRTSKTLSELQGSSLQGPVSDK